MMLFKNDKHNGRSVVTIRVRTDREMVTGKHTVEESRVAVSHRITPFLIPSQHVFLCHFTSHHTISQHFLSRHIISQIATSQHYTKLHHNTTLHYITLHHTTSHHTTCTVLEHTSERAQSGPVERGKTSPI